MNNISFKNQKGLTLIEIMIGIIITSLMMGALYTTYSVVNSTYSQVSEKAKISRSSRDLVSMLMRDIRMAGFKYYAGSQTISKFADDTSGECLPDGMILPKKSYFTFENGFIDEKLSHNPLVIRKDRIGFQNTKDESISIQSDVDGTGLCCDQIEIVYEDFNQNDLNQPFKKYRITYFADEKSDSDGSNKRFAVYKTVESWSQARTDADKTEDEETGEVTCLWPADYDPATEGWQKDCPECVDKELVRDHIEDMEFIPFDKDGLIIKDSAGDYPAPEIAGTGIRKRLFDISGVDIRLTFRSKDDFYKEVQKKTIAGLDDRSKENEDKFLRDSVIVTVNTRNIGGSLF